MANSSFINKIFGFSPHFEMIARRINYHLPFKLTDKTKNKVVNKTENADFEQVIGFLKACGVQQDSLLIVHSAYGNLKGTQLSPQGIIDKLQVLVGTKGTLAMPVIRNYKTYSNAKEYVNDSIDDAVMVYDTQHSAIWTGAIAKQFAKNPNVAISRFPLNTLAAIGPLAAPMMEHNLEGDLPTANGSNSAWKFCLDNSAYIVSIGTDLTHSLTMIHTAEDSNPNWNVKNWYRERKFIIIDGEFRMEKTILERQPHWGVLHFGERKLSHDLQKKGLLRSANIDGILVEVLEAKALVNFLNNKNNTGYPYFWISNKDLEK